MAFNILNIGYDGTVGSSYASKVYRADGEDDLFNYLGTNFGASTFENPITAGHVSVETHNVSSGETSLLQPSGRPTKDTNNYTDFSVSYKLENLIIRPKAFQFFVSGSNATIVNSKLWVKDGTTWVVVSSLPNKLVDNTWSTIANIETFFTSSIRFTWDQNNNGSWGGPSQLAIYGDIKRLDGGQAARSSLATTLEQLPDVDIISPQDGDYLYWDKGVVQHTREKLYETVRTTDNIVLANNQYLPNFYIVTPSSTRTIDLPTNPTQGQFFRFRNLNNTIELQIREPSAVIVETLGGASGPGLTQADCYYDGTEWQIISY